jgi:hypothetical protein
VRVTAEQARVLAAQLRQLRALLAQPAARLLAGLAGLVEFALQLGLPLLGTPLRARQLGLQIAHAFAGRPVPLPQQYGSGHGSGGGSGGADAEQHRVRVTETGFTEQPGASRAEQRGHCYGCRAEGPVQRLRMAMASTRHGLECTVQHSDQAPDKGHCYAATTRGCPLSPSLSASEISRSAQQ